MTGALEAERQAITTTRRHTVDRSGRPAPFSSTAGIEAQSVAVCRATAASPATSRRAARLARSASGTPVAASTAPTRRHEATVLVAAVNERL
ncbi:hypothetical protein ACF061_24385 [Streptomyces sp. NPDC015220]|uniref:hypothetical protein n=1 Tax=Streptomyces sp. NPDC015220 TaxID=3364947 RepID=UPI0037008406